MNTAAEKIPYRLEAVRLTPKDIVLVKVDCSLDTYEMKQLKERVQKEFPKNQVVIVAAGANLSIIKKVKH